MFIIMATRLLGNLRSTTMLKNITIVSLIAVLSACSSSQAGYSEKSAENDKKYAKLAKDKNMVCEFKTQVGSHRKKRTCMTRELAEEVRKRNQEALRTAEKGARTQAHGR